MAVIFRSSIRRRKYDYLIRNGFLPIEAREFSKTSRSGMSAPYYLRMIRSRRRTYDNAIRYGWTEREYRNYIKQKYLNNNFLKQDKIGRWILDPWKLLRYEEERAHRLGEEYESPWRKRTTKKAVKKQKIRRIKRADLIMSNISRIKRSLARTKSPSKRAALEAKLRDYQDMLDKTL